MIEQRILADEIMDACVKSIKAGGKILICGNGGLAAESQHFAAEMVGKFGKDIYVPCIDLTSNSALVTALANDIGFPDVFSHQISVLAHQGDIVIIMTTSDFKDKKSEHSYNIIKAIQATKNKGTISILIGGLKTPKLESDLVFNSNFEPTSAVQNDIVSFLHYLAYNIKRRLLK